ncbi:MAG TPA: hypothetical protein ENN84_05790 [Candidatus Marinimicrobia bacterium]|nr:hypothetical protein [Candidatus Neomarinimicrobiota bacterium]
MISSAKLSRSLLGVLLLAIIFMGKLTAEPNLAASLQNLEIALDSPVLVEEAIWMTMRLRTVFPMLDMEALEQKLCKIEESHPHVQIRYKAGIAKIYLQYNMAHKLQPSLAENISNSQ